MTLGGLLGQHLRLALQHRLEPGAAMDAERVVFQFYRLVYLRLDAIDNTVQVCFGVDGGGIAGGIPGCSCCCCCCPPGGTASVYRFCQLFANLVEGCFADGIRCTIVIYYYLFL